MICRGLFQTACRIGARRLPVSTSARYAPLSVTSKRHFAGGDPRGHLNPDGTRPEAEDAENYHDPDPAEHNPRSNIVTERGRTWVIGEPQADLGTIHEIPQTNLPFWPRERLRIYGNYKLLMKAEYLFFYIPTVIILGIAIPAFTSIYAAEELVASTMTVKVTGRQWYWVYEVESPTDDGEDDDE
uniref:Mitochondrial cytochrome c oxidase subunit 2a n=1 Tax=Karlodinium veneficum TaxID=407301 RepID=A0ESB4_KARVE|nr:mitochondrial cytochrome c oxidase subunit 2a [Karlodinium veneficum]